MNAMSGEIVNKQSALSGCIGKRPSPEQDCKSTHITILYTPPGRVLKKGRDWQSELQRHVGREIKETWVYEGTPTEVDRRELRILP